MCGIAGAVHLRGRSIPGLGARLRVMNALQRHRGPDGQGAWTHADHGVGLAHRRLSVIDLAGGGQPMADPAGHRITFNGEIYNYRELRSQLGPSTFQTRSDTEVILHAYRKWKESSLEHLRGMFAFALWDDREHELFCARDRFGIKPFYYAVVDDVLYFASEAKALLPFLPRLATDRQGLNDYLTFQLCLEGKTLYEGIRELLPGHFLRVRNGQLEVRRYWEVYYDLDFDHTERYFEARVEELLNDSVDLHLRSDVPVGCYVSGGFDSSTVAALAADRLGRQLVGFTGRFPAPEGYDETPFARKVAADRGFELLEADIGPEDFFRRISDVVYHLDYPVAGPGSFPQFMVSELASQHRKVVLGGQGGDEIFGGYARYLIAYFEQCIKAAIDGTMHDGNFIVTYASIIPNLKSLRSYKPLLQEFWREGLFEDLDRRYFRLINRAPQLGDELRREALGDYSPFETFLRIFRANNVQKESYFDSMTHFDFKTLLPALLHVEDRVSMAHGLEARVPLLDHPLVELAATAPSNVKFKNGAMKHLLKNAMSGYVPRDIRERSDKMGFPVPLNEWLKSELHDFVHDLFLSRAAGSRDFVDNQRVLENLRSEPRFGRKLWGYLCLELWQQRFHDRHHEFRSLLSGALGSEHEGGCT